MNSERRCIDHQKNRIESTSNHRYEHVNDKDHLPPNGSKRDRQNSPLARATKDAQTSTSKQNSRLEGGATAVPSKSYQDIAKTTQPLSRKFVSKTIEETAMITKCRELCNLQSPTNNYSSISRRNNARNNPIIGSSHNSKFQAAPRLSFLHVYKLHPDTTATQLKEYLQPLLPEVECDKMESRYPKYYSSFKITINESNLEKAQDPSIWPAGVHVNRFIHPKKTSVPSREP